MSGLEFDDLQALKNAIAEVRSDANDTDWVLFTYENAKSQKIVLAGKGNNGVAGMKEVLKDEIVGYGLIRKTDRIDDSETVKFAHILWLGESVGRMQRARISVHQGGIREFIGQYHVDITCSHHDEISDDIVQEKISDNSGQLSRVMNESGSRVGRSTSVSSSQQSGPKGSGNLQFGNESELREVLRELRHAGEGGTNWMLTGYEGGNSNTIILLGKGDGGADELVQHLTDDIVGYGLVRKVERIDDTDATKFAFIKFQGDNIPRMLRARLGTHSGAILSFFSPYHVTIDATQKSEISDEIVMKAIKFASGTSVHVLSDEQTQRSTPVVASKQVSSSSAAKKPAVPQTLTSSIKFVDEEGVRGDIKDVRNDKTDTDWCLIGYEGKKGNTLVSLGKGSGGIGELVGLLEDDMVGYGLVRKVDKIDDSLTVKFGHIIFIGENINRMHRARLGTHKGAVSELFHPYHVDLEASQPSELTDDVLMKKIQDASGSGSHVKD